MTSSLCGTSDCPGPFPADYMEQWPIPQPGRPMLDLLITTWGTDGPETKASRRRHEAWPWLNLVPLLGYPDPCPFPPMRMIGRQR